MTNRSATSAIGASWSRLTATIASEPCMPDPVLHRARRRPRPEVERGLHDPARLADLARVRHPAGVDGGARRAHDAAEQPGQLLDDREALGAADAPAADDDHAGVLERRLRHRPRRRGRARRRRGRPAATGSRGSTVPAAAAAARR